MTANILAQVAPAIAIKSGIYKITRIETGKSYIGQSKELKRRLRGHKKAESESLIHRAIRKYGLDAFSFEVIIAVNDPEILDLFEIGCIRTFNTLSPNGYNLTGGGNINLFSADTLSKLIGRKFTEEHRKKIGLANSTRPYNAAAMQKQRDTKKRNALQISANMRASRALMTQEQKTLRSKKMLDGIRRKREAKNDF